jgi:hypothetical protein
MATHREGERQKRRQPMREDARKALTPSEIADRRAGKRENARSEKREAKRAEMRQART